MKLNRTVFSILQSLICVAAIGSSCPAFAKSDFEIPSPFQSVGISEKGSFSYQDLADQVFELFKKQRAPFIVLNHGVRPSSEMQQEFSNFCMDHDLTDLVSWRTGVDGVLKISFSCTLDGEQPRLRERLFVFSIENSEMIDVKIAAADISPETLKSLSTTPINGFKEKSPLTMANSSDKVMIAVSGAMISGGVTASTDATGTFQAKELTSRQAGAGALVAGVGAVVSHFIFDMAPSKSGLTGGALSIALEDYNANLPDPMTGQARTRVVRKIDGNGSSGLGPVSVRLSFKFW